MDTCKHPVTWRRFNSTVEIVEKFDLRGETASVSHFTQKFREVQERSQRESRGGKTQARFCPAIVEEFEFQVGNLCFRYLLLYDLCTFRIESSIAGRFCENRIGKEKLGLSFRDFLVLSGFR